MGRFTSVIPTDDPLVGDEPDGPASLPDAPVDTPSQRELPIRSDFALDHDGWRLDGGAFGGLTAPRHSATEQFVHVDDARFAYWHAPAKFHGNLADAYGTGLTFYAAENYSCCSSLPRVVLAGNGLTLYHNPRYPAYPNGAAFWIWLDETERWFVAGTQRRATVEELRKVLANVSQLRILAGNSGYSWLDDVELGATTEEPAALPRRSNFDRNAEGWRLTGGAFGVITPPEYLSDGFVQAREASFAGWLAPTLYRGNFIHALDTTISFDAAWDDACCKNTSRIVLFGGGHVIFFSPDSDPSETFATFGARLSPTAEWFTEDGGVRRVTVDEFMAVLENLQLIRLLTGDTGATLLDNFSIGE